MNTGSQLLRGRLPGGTLARLVRRHETAAGATLRVGAADHSGLPVNDDDEVVARIEGPRPFAALLAASLTEALATQHQLDERLTELSALHQISRLTAESRDLDAALQKIVRLVADVTGARATSLRLLQDDADELKIAAVHNLSDGYLDKGTIRLQDARIDQEALGENGHAMVADMRTDDRVLFPEQAKREGIVSALVAGLRAQGRALGVIRIYTDRPHTFRRREVDLLQSVASMAASAIANVRLREDVMEAERAERQLEMASGVQQRMLPQQQPELPGLSFAGTYIPALELGGDIYDYIPLPDDNMGILVADVSGKGVAAALIGMAVRASLRAQVDHIYSLAEAVGGLNHMLHRDTRLGEFVTLFYGVLDVKARRLTYCCAGHPPALLWRGGQVKQLTTDDILLGIEPDARFHQATLDLHDGDRLMIYTDGLPDAQNFAGERFGDARILETFAQGARHPSAADAAAHLRRTLRNYVGLADRSDDVTTVHLHVGPQE